jgi:hypothetical protein
MSDDDLADSEAIEYCPECSTWIGEGPESRTDCPECGAELAG